MLILGIDPGNNGAYGIIDAESGALVDVGDLPTHKVKVNRTYRDRLDAPALFALLESLALTGVELAFLEAVGGRPAQAASAAYVLGHGVGMVEMGLVGTGIAYHLVPPQRWKGALGIAGKKASIKRDKIETGTIVDKAIELMPDGKSKFIGTRGGKLVDRAEAAMIAYFGAFWMLPLLEDK